MLVYNRFNNKIDDDYKTFTRRFDALKRHLTSNSYFTTLENDPWERRNVE